MEFIIWSKDRSSQLYLLLESIDKCFRNVYHKVNVLYKATDGFEEGYAACSREFCCKPNGYNLIKEYDFYSDSIKLLEEARPMICLLTDDTVFYDTIEDRELEARFNFMNLDPRNIFSFRLGRNTVIQDHINQTKQKQLEQPCIDKIIYWKPNTYPNYTNNGYPFAIDAHLYHKSFLLPKMKSFEWKNTNILEGGLQKFTKEVNTLGCFEKSKAVNVPYNNLSGLTMVNQNNNMSIQEANDVFLSGKKIDLRTIEETRIVGCHQDVELKWTERIDVS